MKKRINKYDIGLIVAIIVINVFLIWYSGRNVVKLKDKVAYIYSNNEIVKEIVLTDDVSDEFKVETETGYNTIRIEGGQLWIEDASCPDKVCIYQGKISSDGEIIVCLPNRMLIKIVDYSEENN